MALFTVNRYLPTTESDTDSDRPSPLLSKLKERIEQRQVSRKYAGTPLLEQKFPTAPEIHRDSSQSFRSATKRRHSDNDESAAEHDDNNEIKYQDPERMAENPEQEKKKRKRTHKKKKRKYPMVEDEEPDENVDRNEADDEGDNMKQEAESGNEGTADGGQEKGQEEVGSFLVLGRDAPRRAVAPLWASLPDWLQNPTVLSSQLDRHQVAVNSIPLSSDLCKILSKHGIKSLFPVQAAVIPEILRNAHGPLLSGPSGWQPRDICVSAPTGSGKTLSYVLPIVQALKSRVVPKIRALVLLPTRDLAVQVKGVFDVYCQHAGLTVGLLTGQTSFTKQQESVLRSCPVTGCSAVDILVATPGRLVDHITYTPGFALNELRFLVLDEVDRLLDQPFQDWLNKVLSSSERRQSSFLTDANHAYSSQTVLTSAVLARPHLPLQKLLFSATLTQDPEKLSRLQLFRPHLFTVVPKENLSDQVTDNAAQPERGHFAGRYSTPDGLKEHIVVCAASHKPLIVYYMLAKLAFQHVLCFTGSLQSTHRLYLLFQLMGDVSVAEFSSQLTRGQRQRMLDDFKHSKHQLLICSDAMARGMDIEQVEHVISYDAPPFLKTHIHRMGRTARAGRYGNGYTILRAEEVRHFKQMMRSMGKTALDKLKIGEEQLEPFLEHYKSCLSQLEDALQAEKAKALSNRSKR